MKHKSKTIFWEGYIFQSGKYLYIHSIELSKKEFDFLWKKFKNWTGKQRNFYFKFVNPMKFRRLLK